MRKGIYKLIYYTGYESEDTFEMYDLQEDPEELNNLEKSGTSIAESLKEELLEKFNSVNVKYRETRK